MQPFDTFTAEEETMAISFCLLYNVLQMCTYFLSTVNLIKGVKKLEMKVPENARKHFKKFVYPETFICLPLLEFVLFVFLYFALLDEFGAYFWTSYAFPSCDTSSPVQGFSNQDSHVLLNKFLPDSAEFALKKLCLR